MLASEIGLPLSSVIRLASSSACDFDQIGDLQQIASALMRPYRGPLAGLKSSARGFYGFFDILFVTLRHQRQDFLVGRVDRLKGRARPRGHPFTVDQKLFLGLLVGRHARRLSRLPPIL
jgi:hypothetical protein